MDFARDIEYTAPKDGIGTQIDAPGYGLLEWDGRRWNAFEKESTGASYMWSPCILDHGKREALRAFLEAEKSK